MYSGHIAGRVVRTLGGKFPYKVVMTPTARPEIDHCFATMREAEAFIRLSTPPTRPALSTLYDRNAGES
jgi:hypothetical protein